MPPGTRRDLPGRLYAHTATNESGISGGPLVCVEDGAVYDVVSRSVLGQYSLASDVTEILDWRVPFLPGSGTLRALASERPDLVTLAL